MPVTIASPAVNASTVASRPTSALRGSARGQTASSACSPQEASTSPRAPAVRASSALSVRSWRTRRPRPAPSARRIAISRRRAVARVRRRFAALAQAMSSTSATAPSSTQRRVRTSPMAESRSGIALKSIWSMAATRVRVPPPGAGAGPPPNATRRRGPVSLRVSSAIRFDSTSRSLCACRSVTPGASRATAFSAWKPRFVSAWGSSATIPPTGVQTSMSVSGK
jgi:hypothetical protein